MSPAGSGPEFYVTFGSGRVKSGQENWTRARRTLCYMLFTCTLLLQQHAAATTAVKRLTHGYQSTFVGHGLKSRKNV